MPSLDLPDISVSFAGGKKVDASFGSFLIPTDQAVMDGGEASAPQPFMLFLASLATCAGIFVLGFCQKREIDAEGIHLTQTQKFAEGPDGKPRLAEIGIQIHVPPTFPEKYQDALVRVANQCAVKQVIQDPPEFVVETCVSEA
ncbi:OsmC family protein [Magnetococcus sp. PR-3]|uniref:OsmC family protein n=1 Tax=Magnetococcus sp. PR-3 TaxID=3120355 RepID=UPI002FCE021C